MAHLATVHLALGESHHARALHDLMGGSNYAGPLTDHGRAAIDAVRRTRPDVLIVGPGLTDGMSPEDVLRAVKGAPETADLQVFVLNDTPISEAAEVLLDNGVDDAVVWPCPPEVVLARTRPLVRIATMREELYHRKRLAGGTAMPPEPGAETEPPYVLLISDTGAAEDLEAVLGSQGMLTQSVDVFEAQGLLDARLHDAAIIMAHDNVESYLDFCLQIRRNPRLFNVPVVLMVDEAALPDINRAYDMGASAVLPSDASPAEIRFVLLTLVRRQRLRWDIRRALAATLDTTNADTTARETYSRSYLERYLAYRVPAALKAERELSVVAFDFDGVEAIRSEFGKESEASLLDQIGQWLTILVRAEDLVARQAGARFVAVLPDTPLSEAGVVLDRVVSVIARTDFAVKDVFRVVNVWPVAHAAALTESDDARSLLARASALPGFEENAGA